MPVARHLRPIGQRAARAIQLRGLGLRHQQLELFQRHLQFLNLGAARLPVGAAFTQATRWALLSLAPVVAAAALWHGSPGLRPGHQGVGWCRHGFKHDRLALPWERPDVTNSNKFGGHTDPGGNPDTAPMTATAHATARPWLVHLKLLGMAGLWGAAWPAGKVVASQAPALSASAWRFGLSLLLLLAWLLARSGTATLRALTPRQWAGLALGGALGVFGYAAFFLMGLQHLPAGRAALVVTTNPVLTLLLAAWLLGERLNARIGLGMALAVGGAAVVLTHAAPWTLFTGGAGVGEALLMGCVVCWSAYTLLGKRLLAGIDALSTTTVTAGFGLVLLLLSAALFEPGGLARPLQLGFEWWAALLFMVVGSTVLAYAWYFEGVAALGAGAASAYISLVPVFGVAVATLWLGEAVDASLLAGGALVMAGMVLMNRARR